MSEKNTVFKHHNAIIELSRIISEMAWKGVDIEDPFVLNPSEVAALADAINVTANEALALTQFHLIDNKGD